MRVHICCGILPCMRKVSVRTGKTQGIFFPDLSINPEEESQISLTEGLKMKFSESSYNKIHLKLLILMLFCLFYCCFF